MSVAAGSGAEWGEHTPLSFGALGADFGPAGLVPPLSDCDAGTASKRAKH